MMKRNAIKKLEDERNALNTPFTDMMCQQIIDLIASDADAEKVLEKDKSIVGCKKTFDKYAGDHKQGGESCIPPNVAEELIKKYYGLEKNQKSEPKIISIADFL